MPRRREARPHVVGTITIAEFIGPTLSYPTCPGGAPVKLDGTDDAPGAGPLRWLASLCARQDAGASLGGTIAEAAWNGALADQAWDRPLEVRAAR